MNFDTGRKKLQHYQQHINGCSAALLNDTYAGTSPGGSEGHMNIKLSTQQMCVGKKKQKGSDGKTDFYSIAVATEEGDAGNLSCDEEIYDKVEPFKVYQFNCVYRDGQYKGLRIVDAFLAKGDDAGKKQAAK